ncbi:hypothetical protein HRbin17_01093 [bacterium HR17]|uniref:Uncharacterized protein n=1 Tax=Candidatus Fervidibacter japonicus TaxID=2035412 RepID=A0A2H5XBK9_9BACT|nr:hypothetical protein HRbin17_01093 [bacterium HR17]
MHRFSAAQRAALRECVVRRAHLLMHRFYFGGSESRPPRVCRSEGASPDAPLFLRRLKRAALRECVVRRAHLLMHRSFFGGSREPPSESASFGGRIS